MRRLSLTLGGLRASAGLCRVPRGGGGPFRWLGRRGRSRMLREVMSRPGRALPGRLPVAWPSALLLVAVLASLPAAAEERKNSWEAGLFAGYTIFGHELQVDDGGDFGLRVGWNFAPPYELELQIYRSFGTEITDTGSTLLDNDAVFLNNRNREWTATAYTARFVINPRNERRRLKPYMQFGLGMIDWKPSPSLDESDAGETDDWLFSVGGGIRYKLGAYTQ